MLRFECIGSFRLSYFPEVAITMTSASGFAA
jgi:hypothetical protein